jgi:hypothetical protein
MIRPEDRFQFRSGGSSGDLARLDPFRAIVAPTQMHCWVVGWRSSTARLRAQLQDDCPRIALEPEFPRFVRRQYVATPVFENNLALSAGFEKKSFCRLRSDRQCDEIIGNPMIRHLERTHLVFFQQEAVFQGAGPTRRGTVLRAV